MTIGNPVMLGVLALLCAAAWLRPGEGTRAALSRPERFLLWALIAALTLTRLWRFGAVPGGMNQDGAMAAVDALSLSRYGTDRFGVRFPAHFRAWGYGQMSVLLSWCMVPFLRAFGLSPLTARLPMLLWSLAGMAAFYVFVRRTVSERAALAGLLFLAMNPWHFMQSRWALDCNVFPHAFLIGLALLERGREKPACTCASMLFFGLCMYSYGVSFVMLPPFLVLAALLLRVPLRRTLLCALLYLGVSWPIYATMLINALKLETIELPFVTLSRFYESVRAGDLLFFSPRPLAQLAVNARALWRVGFLQAHDLPWNDIAGFGTIYRCSAPLMLLGGVHTARDALRDKRGGARLALLYFFCALFLGLCVNSVNVNRLNILFYAELLFCARGIEALLSFRRETAALLLAGYGLFFALFLSAYFGPWARQMEHLFYKDFLAAVVTADGLGTERLYITPDVQYPGSRDTSEILTQFALGIDAKAYASADYAARYRYQNTVPALLAAEEQSCACVLLPGQSLPPGWREIPCGEYSVYTNAP